MKHSLQNHTMILLGKIYAGLIFNGPIIIMKR